MVRLTFALSFILAFSGILIGQEIENLLINPDFEEGTNGWVLELHGDKGAVAQLVVDKKEALTGKQCMLIDIQKLDGSGTWWHVGLNQPVSVEAGKTYTLAVWAKTEPEKVRTILLAGGENHGPWTNWGSKEFTITDEWAEYHTTWNQLVADNNARIRIAVGHSKDNVWVDHVRFYVGEYKEEDLKGMQQRGGMSVNPSSKLASMWGRLKSR